MPKKKRAKTWHRQAKAKGRDAENDVVAYLRTRHGIPAERRRLTGYEDCGDISGWEDTVVSVKALKTITLASILDELDEQATNAMKRGLVRVAPWKVAIVKRRGTKDPGRWYAVMSLDMAMAAISGDQRAAGRNVGTNFVAPLRDTDPHGTGPEPPKAA